MNERPVKSIKQILDQYYVSAKDLQKIFSDKISIKEARKIIKKERLKAEELGYFIPNARELLVPTILIKKNYLKRLERGLYEKES